MTGTGWVVLFLFGVTFLTLLFLIAVYIGDRKKARQQDQAHKERLRQQKKNHDELMRQYTRGKKKNDDT